METDLTDYAHVRGVWLAQKKMAFDMHESHVLRKRAGTTVSFEQLSATLARIGDICRNRATEARQPQDESGRNQYGEGFALVDQNGVGLFVRVRETGEKNGPSYTYFHATSVGLERLVLAADLALVDDFTLAPISTPEILTIIMQANLLRDEMDGVHAAIARECSRLGYTSQSHANIDAVDALWKQTHWPSNSDLPLKRMELQLGPKNECPAVPQLLSTLAHIYSRLDGGKQPDPSPVQTTGGAGLGRYFVLLRDAAHGLKFVLDVVEEREQFPKGRWGISLRSVGLADLFISSRRVLSLGEDEPPEAMQVETQMVVCVTGSPDAQRLTQAMDVITKEFAGLGYHVASVETSIAGNHPD